jgi:hypothetical protein
MATILPLPSKTVIIGSNDFQSLINGVRLIHLGSTKKEDTVLEIKSNTQIVLYIQCYRYKFFYNYKFQIWEMLNIVHWACTVQLVK